MFLVVMGSFLPLEGLEIECVKNSGPGVSRESPDCFLERPDRFYHHSEQHFFEREVKLDNIYPREIYCSNWT